MEWKACSEEKIENCFLHCFKTESGRIVDVDESRGVNEIRKEMEHIAADQEASFKRAGIDELVHPEEEHDVVESVWFKKIGWSAVGLEDFVTDEPEQDELGEPDGLHTVNEELKNLTVSTLP